MQISSKNSYAYAELLEVLSFTNINLVKKIPTKLISLFEENASAVYKYHLSHTIPLEEQDISIETASLLTLISLNYWCESEEEKNKIRAVLNENEKIKNEKYNPNNIFQSQTKTINPTLHKDLSQNILPIDISRLPWYSKVLNKIINLFSKLIKKSN